MEEWKLAPEDKGKGPEDLWFVQWVGVDRIKRIKSFTAVTLTSISQDDIDYVLAKLSAS